MQQLRIALRSLMIRLNRAFGLVLVGSTVFLTLLASNASHAAASPRPDRNASLLLQASLAQQLPAMLKQSKDKYSIRTDLQLCLEKRSVKQCEQLAQASYLENYRLTFNQLSTHLQDCNEQVTLRRQLSREIRKQGIHYRPGHPINQALDFARYRSQTTALLRAANAIQRQEPGHHQAAHHYASHYLNLTDTVQNLHCPTLLQHYQQRLWQQETVSTERVHALSQARQACQALTQLPACLTAFYSATHTLRTTVEKYNTSDHSPGWYYDELEAYQSAPQDDQDPPSP